MCGFCLIQIMDILWFLANKFSAVEKNCSTLLRIFIDFIKLVLMLFNIPEGVSWIIETKHCITTKHPRVQAIKCYSNILYTETKCSSWSNSMEPSFISVPPPKWWKQLYKGSTDEEKTAPPTAIRVQIDIKP